jgi:hypothetical protein
MRPLLARAVSIDGILENMGHMRSPAVEALRNITRRYHGIMRDPREWRVMAGAGEFAMRKRAPGPRRQAGAET